MIKVKWCFQGQIDLLQFGHIWQGSSSESVFTAKTIHLSTLFFWTGMLSLMVKLGQEFKSDLKNALSFAI